MARQYGNDEQARRRRKDRCIFAVICFIVALVAAFTETTEEHWQQVVVAFNQMCGEYTDLNAPVPEGQMIIHMIDVGQGDSVLVQCNEASILIDAGETDKGDEVVDYLRSVGVSALDWVVCTHPHSDHIGGVPEVLEELQVRQVMVPVIPESLEPEDRYYTRFLDAVRAEGITPTNARPGDVYTFGDLTMTVLWPTASFDGADLNDWSIALRFSYGGLDYLCCGDMTESAEDDLMATGADIRAEIVKSNHHGSTYANGSDFLYAVAPELALISCGLDNDYGHPHDQLLDRYDYYNIQWKRTDVCGSVRVVCENGAYTIETEN